MEALWSLEARDLLARAGVELAILFGSAASGKLRSGSDLDVGVVPLPGGLATLDQELSLAVALEALAHREVDLVRLDRGSSLLRREAASGRPLHEARPGAFADFTARAWMEYEDVRPHLLRGGRGLMRRLSQGR